MEKRLLKKKGEVRKKMGKKTVDMCCLQMRQRKLLICVAYR